MTRLALLALLFVVPAADATVFGPSAGRVLSGVSAQSPASFADAVGGRPAVYGEFVQWGQSMEYVFNKAEAADARLLLSLSTAPAQNRPGRISPGEIARGEGDAWLVGFGERLAVHGAPVYLRPFGEMNNCDNAYAPVGCDGRARGADHSSKSLVRAWRRMAIVLDGGDRSRVDSRLRAVGLPAVRTGRPVLAAPRVALVWSPMTGGSPMIPSLDPSRFWPGSEYVDWVGTSFYSRFQTWSLLESYYRRFAVRYRKPMAFAEWAVWGADDPAWVRRFFRWGRSHPRVRMIVYNGGYRPDGPFRLGQYPRSRAAIRAELRSPRYRAE